MKLRKYHKVWENVGVFCMTALVREGYHRPGIWRNFRRFFEHSDCSRRTVWAQSASSRQEQSISGAEKARKLTCLGGGIPPGRAQVMWKNSGNDWPENRAVWKCTVDQESGVYMIAPTGTGACLLPRALSVMVQLLKMTKSVLKMTSC